MALDGTQGIIADDARQALRAEAWEARAGAVCALAGRFWDRQAALADSLCQPGLFTNAGRAEIKVVGILCARAPDSGIQRGLSRLIGLWREQNYEVVLFTDDDAAPEALPLPGEAACVRLRRGSSQCGAASYAERGMHLAALLKERHVDCMVCHACFADTMLFDSCICKALGVPFILCDCDVFSRALRRRDRAFSLVPKAAKLAGAVVCMDGASEQWWRCFNGNTHQVSNMPDAGAQWAEIFASLAREPDNPSDYRMLAEVLINDYLAGCERGPDPPAGLWEKARRYYAQFGFRSTVRRAIEKITGDE